MIITVNNKTTATHYRRLEELMTRWPAGLMVRHVNGWTGQIARDDDPRHVLGFGLGEEARFTGHALVGDAAHNTAVCVARTLDGRTVTAWYRPAVLTPIGKDAPAAPKPAPKPKSAAPRKRTWKGAAA